jgi:ABC-type transport system substrate-binding protein
VNNAVLVLNQNYEPLNVCNVRRALVLVIGGKAEILEASQRGLASATTVFPAPSVIRLMYMIRRRFSFAMNSPANIAGDKVTT